MNQCLDLVSHFIRNSKGVGELRDDRWSYKIIQNFNLCHLRTWFYFICGGDTLRHIFFQQKRLCIDHEKRWREKNSIFFFSSFADDQKMKKFLWKLNMMSHVYNIIGNIAIFLLFCWDKNYLLRDLHTGLKRWCWEVIFAVGKHLAMCW